MNSAQHATAQQPVKVEVIVVPTDFSRPATRALEVAMLMAKQFGASVDLVHVDQTATAMSPGAAADIAAPTLPGPLLEEQRQVVRARLQGIAQRYSEQAVPTGADVVPSQGNEARAIIAAAIDHGADLIIMGTHGRSGLRRLVLGSVAEAVLRHSPIPVLTVPPDEREASAA